MTSAVQQRHRKVQCKVNYLLRTPPERGPRPATLLCKARWSLCCKGDPDQNIRADTWPFNLKSWLVFTPPPRCMSDYRIPPCMSD